MKREYPDREQRLAVCYSQWRKDKGTKAMALTHNSTVADSEPGWGTVDKTKLPRKVFAGIGETDKKSTWEYAHHWVKDGGEPDDDGAYTTGTMYLHKDGLRAALAAASEASTAVKSHLNTHKKTIDMAEEGKALRLSEWHHTAILKPEPENSTKSDYDYDFGESGTTMVYGYPDGVRDLLPFAIQFDSETYTIEQAKKWLADGGYKPQEVIAASPAKADTPEAVSKSHKPVMIPAERSQKDCPQARMLAAPILEGKVAELDPGWIEGYAATFNNVDLMDERILPGAFDKTIKKRVPTGKVKLMATHYADGGGASEVIGTITQAREDDTGLWMHSILSRTRTAQEIRQNVLDGHIGYFSIGYVTKDSEAAEVDGKDIQDLKELAWYETTVTTIPVNELAIITNAKAEAVLEKVIPEDTSDPLKAKLTENRDAVEGKAAEMNILIAKRIELLDPEAEAESTDTTVEDSTQETVVNPMTEEIERKKLALEELINAP